jgi:pyruvate dehydrogenase E1 component alpha subunit
MSDDGMSDDRMRWLRHMVFVRAFEERCAQLYTEGRIRGFLHLATGQEAVAVGVAEALAPEDNCVATYREHAHALVRGVDPVGIMAEMFGLAQGVCRGRGGSMHLFDVAHRFYGGNAIVAGGLPIAVGLGLADRLRADTRVTVVFFGEGAMAEGEFHECVNLAALWHLPVLFCCENNRYAMGTALDRSESTTDLALRAAGYGIASWAVDGMDVEAVVEAARRAVTTVRSGAGPVFLELRTYRFRAHSMYDPERYRTREEVARWRAEHDPIELLASRLQAAGTLDAAGLDGVRVEAEAQVDTAVAAAQTGTPEPVEDLLRHVTGPRTS